MLHINPTRTNGSAHINEIDDWVAWNCEKPLAKTIGIGDAGHLLRDAVTKQRRVHQNNTPKKTILLKQGPQKNGIPKTRVLDQELGNHVSHHKITTRIDAMHEWGAAVPQQRVSHGRRTPPSPMLPTLKRRSHDPTGFLFHGLKEREWKIFANGHAFGDLVARNRATRLIAAENLALDRIINEPGAKSRTTQLHTHHVILGQTADLKGTDPVFFC